jgi:hypothetical protein
MKSENNEKYPTLNEEEFLTVISGHGVNLAEFSRFYNRDYSGKVISINIHDVQMSYINIGQKWFDDTKEDIVYELPIVIESGFYEGITISSGIFEKGFVIRGGEFVMFNIEGGKFIGEQNENYYSSVGKDSFEISGGDFKMFSIKGGHFINDCAILGANFHSTIWITGGEFNKITFSGVKNSFGLYVMSCRVNNTFEIQNNGMEEITISQGASKIEINELKISFIYKGYTKIYSCVIKNLLLTGIIAKEGVIEVTEGAIIGNMIFDRVNNNGFIYIKGIYFENINKKTLLNYNEVIISNSDLGKVLIIGCDFSSSTLNFSNSKITDIFLAGTRMPSKVHALDYEQKRLGYSQIKKIYEARGDNVEANRYLAKEMSSYFNQLIRPGFSLSGIKQLISNLPEIFNLGLNFISSNFGQSWFLALVTTLIVSFLSLELFFYTVGLSATFQLFPPRWYPEIFELDRLNYFWEYLLPLTKIDFLEGECLPLNTRYSTASKTVFYVSKYVVIPYFIYQFIQAFRKHGKKGG